MVKMHITGIDALIRSFDRKSEAVNKALEQGVNDAADHIIECIEDRFGEYQTDGSTRNGPWAKLKYKTRLAKKRKGNGVNSNKPLVDYGDMMFSFDKVTSNRTRKFTVTVVSNDPKLKFHIYGAPSAGVPRRDPVRPVLESEREECYNIISDAVEEGLKE